MPRGIGNNEFAFFTCKEAIRYINRNALLSFSSKAVHQQCKIDVLALGAKLFRVRLQRANLVFKDVLGLPKESTN